MECHNVTFAIFIISLILYVRGQAGPECLYCSGGLSQPSDCKDTIQCEADEKCFTDKYITVAGKTSFSVGCRAKSICLPSGKRANRKRQLPAAVHICEECCDGELCNARGCNSKPRGPKCLYCSGGLSKPYDCTNTIQCEADEKCFTDKYITIAGNSFFSVGCRAKSICLPSGKRANRKRQLSPEVHICEECCDGEFCNARGCNASRPSRTHCYHCGYVNDPRRCEQIKTCQVNEQCFIEEVLTDEFRLKYNLGCMKNFLCEQISLSKGKREGDFPAVCSRCCKGDYCNLWCGKEAPSTTTIKQTTESTMEPTTTTLMTTTTTTSTTTTTQPTTKTTSTSPPPSTTPQTTTTTTPKPTPPTTKLTTTVPKLSTTTTQTTTSLRTTEPTTSTTTTPTTTITTTTTTTSTTTITTTTVTTKTSTTTTSTTTTTRAPAVCYECQFEKDMNECHHSVQCRDHYNTPNKEYSCFSGRVLDNGCFFTASCMVREACAVFRNRTRNGESVIVKGYEYDDVECCDTPNCNHKDLIIPPIVAKEHNCGNNP